jgi:transposase
MTRTLTGLDIAKHVFQAHWVDEFCEITRRTLRRAQVVEFFAVQELSIVAMEACGSAHHWARKFTALGHEVRLPSAQFVKPSVKNNKTDMADAEAIWEAAQRPGMRFVAEKTEEQQAVLSLHRMRAQLVKFRTMQVNQLRGLIAEFGGVLPAGRKAMMPEAAKPLGETTISIPGMLRDALVVQLGSINQLSEQIEAIEQRINGWRRREEDCKRIAAIPGVGMLGATAAIAVTGDAKTFRSDVSLPHT